MAVNLLRLKEQLVLHEDNKEFPYEDTVGKLTIGIGHNLTDDGLTERIRDIIFWDDVDTKWQDLNANFGHILDGLNEVRQRVLLDMCLNLGINKLANFHHMWDAIERHDWEHAAAAMLESKWAKQVKTRAVRLAKMMLTGEDYGSNSVPV